MHCDGAVTFASGTLTWTGTMRFHFTGSDGIAYQNTVAASSIALSDNEFAYVDLVETDGSGLSVSKASITTGSASTLFAYNRIVLGYRNTTSDSFYPVGLRPAGTTNSSGTISLFAEYPGASLTASGSNNDPGSLGMTSDLYVSGNTFINYYEWNSDTSSSLQSYDVFVQTRMPLNFKSFQTGTNTALVIQICTQENSATNNKIDITIQKDGSATTSAHTGLVSGTSGVWTSNGYDETDSVLSALVAGDILNIRMRLYSFNSKYTRVGRIDLAVILQ
jgi:hypothetical protein